MIWDALAILIEGNVSVICAEWIRILPNCAEFRTIEQTGGMRWSGTLCRSICWFWWKKMSVQVARNKSAFLKIARNSAGWVRFQTIERILIIRDALAVDWAISIEGNVSVSCAEWIHKLRGTVRNDLVQNNLLGFCVGAQKGGWCLRLMKIPRADELVRNMDCRRRRIGAD